MYTHNELNKEFDEHLTKILFEKHKLTPLELQITFNRMDEIADILYEEWRENDTYQV